MTDGEVEANLSFGQLRRGDRILVDINDPAVKRLLAAGYYKIRWKEFGDGGMDSGRSGSVSGVGVAVGMVRSPEVAQVDDGTDQSGSSEGGADSAESGDPAGAEDDTAGFGGGA